MRAIEKLKSDKTGGESSILLEMVKVAYIGDKFPKRLLELVHNVLWMLKECVSPSSTSMTRSCSGSILGMHVRGS